MRCDGIHNAPEGLNVATVHVLCRKNYTRFPNAAAAPSSSTTTVSEKHILRSCVIDFDYKMPCFLIAKEISESSKYKQVFHLIKNSIYEFIHNLESILEPVQTQK